MPITGNTIVAWTPPAVRLPDTTTYTPTAPISSPITGAAPIRVRSTSGVNRPTSSGARPTIKLVRPAGHRRARAR